MILSGYVRQIDVAQSAPPSTNRARFVRETEDSAKMTGSKMALVRRVCPLGGLRPLRGRSAALRAASRAARAIFHFCVNMNCHFSVCCLHNHVACIGGSTRAGVVGTARQPSCSSQPASAQPTRAPLLRKARGESDDWLPFGVTSLKNQSKNRQSENAPSFASSISC